MIWGGPLILAVLGTLLLVAIVFDRRQPPWPPEIVP